MRAEPIEVYVRIVNPEKPDAAAAGCRAPFIGTLPTDLDARIRRGHVRLQGDGIARADGDAEPGDEASINALIRDLSAAGGGVIHAERTAKFYALKKPVVLRHGVQIVGDGYDSCFRNVNATMPPGREWQTMAFLAGTYGGYGESSGLFCEAGYPVEDLATGARRIMLSNPADATRFRRGDLVALYASHSDAGEHGLRHMLVTEVMGVDDSANTLVLRHPVADNYTADTSCSPATPVRICILNTGNAPGLDGSAAFCAVQVGLHNLRAEQNALPHRQALHLSCYDSHFSRLWLKGTSRLTGSPCARTIIEHLRGEYGGKPDATASGTDLRPSVIPVVDQIETGAG